MYTRYRSHFLVLLVFGLNILCPASARAALGGNEAGVAADAAGLNGEVHSTSLPYYVVQEIVSPDGIRVREFLDRAGGVFAVAWNGPAVPDLRVLLGPSFAIYAKAMAGLAHPGLKRSLRIASGDLVVEFGGHMRAYSGRAYLPGRVPAGVPPADLR